MTRRLLAAAGESRVPGWAWLLLGPPLLLVAACTVAADLVRAAARYLLEAQVLSASEGRCPAGDVIALVGAYRCSDCGLTSVRSGFAACPDCGAYAAAIACACGHVVRNPLFTPEES